MVVDEVVKEVCRRIAVCRDQVVDNDMGWYLFFTNKGWGLQREDHSATFRIS